MWEDILLCTINKPLIVLSHFAVSCLPQVPEILPEAVPTASRGLPWSDFGSPALVGPIVPLGPIAGGLFLPLGA